MKTKLHLLFVLFALVYAIPSFAHHSFSATFQEGAKITREGVVTDFSFRNPHILVYFDVTNEDGSVTGWVSEGAAATLMRRRGWSRNSLEAGDVIRVFGDSTHDGSPMTSIDTLDIIDPSTGAVVEALMEQEGQQRQQQLVKAPPVPLTLPDGKPNLTGAWTNHGMSDGRPRRPQLSFSEAGAALQAQFDLANDPQVFCDPPGLVRQVATTPHPIRITQFDDRIEFEYEEYGGARTVYFDDRAHLGVRTHLGDSIARYEGDTLVIKTTNLLANQASPEGDVLSDQTTTREIYTRADDEAHGSIVNLDMYMTDPVNLSEVLVMSRRKMSAGDYEFIENDCQTPLRERGKVHTVMNFFVSADIDESDASCAGLAAEVAQDNKNWIAASSPDALGSSPIYSAKGELLSSNLSELNELPDHQGRPVSAAGDLVYCSAQ